MLNEKQKYLKRIIKQIVKESATNKQVMNAIQRRREVKIFYDSNDSITKGKKMRVIQPVAYGLSKSGNEIVRAFQPFGDTKSRTPAWKTFRLDRIKKWVETRKIFDEPPGNQWNVNNEPFNPNGDGSMSEVYKIANFNSPSKYKNNGLQRYNQQRQNSGPQGQELINKIKGRKSYNAKDFDYIQRNIDNWKKPSNWDSIWDMQQVNDFGDEDYGETDMPITKNYNPEMPDNNGALNYQNAMDNGPITKHNNKAK